MNQARVLDDAMSKAMWRVLPLLCLGYLVAYMDRVNISFASLQMNADLGFSATVYGFGGGLFFLSYALFEVPSNMLLARFGARRWIARIMVTWGIIAVGMMFVRTPTQFYVMRFLLGVAEAGFLPGVIFYLSGWFPVRYRGRAISRFYVAGPLAGILMGAVSGALLSLNGRAGLAGWQWLFLVQGLPAVAVAAMLLLWLPDSPRNVTWLSEAERASIQCELEREARQIGAPGSHNPLAPLVNPLVLLLGLFGALTVGASITLTLSVPQLLRDQTGLNAFGIGWIVSVSDVLGAIGVLLCGILTDRRGERWTVLLVSTALTMVGYLGLSLSLGTSAILVVAAYLACKFVYIFVAGSSVMLWPDLMHPRQMAVGLAAMNTLTQLGAFFLPWGWGFLKDVTGSFRVGLLILAAVTAVAWLIAFALVRKSTGINREDLSA